MVARNLLADDRTICLEEREGGSRAHTLSHRQILQRTVDCIVVECTVAVVVGIDIRFDPSPYERSGWASSYEQFHEHSQQEVEGQEGEVVAAACYRCYRLLDVCLGSLKDPV